MIIAPTHYKTFVCQAQQQQRGRYAPQCDKIRLARPDACDPQDGCQQEAVHKRVGQDASAHSTRHGRLSEQTAHHFDIRQTFEHRFGRQDEPVGYDPRSGFLYVIRSDEVATTGNRR